MAARLDRENKDYQELLISLTKFVEIVKVSMVYSMLCIRNFQSSRQHVNINEGDISNNFIK